MIGRSLNDIQTILKFSECCWKSSENIFELTTVIVSANVWLCEQSVPFDLPRKIGKRITKSPSQPLFGSSRNALLPCGEKHCVTTHIKAVKETRRGWDDWRIKESHGC